MVPALGHAVIETCGPVILIGLQPTAHGTCAYFLWDLPLSQQLAGFRRLDDRTSTNAKLIHLVFDGLVCAFHFAILITLKESEHESLPELRTFFFCRAEQAQQLGRNSGDGLVALGWLVFELSLVQPTRDLAVVEGLKNAIPVGRHEQMLVPAGFEILILTPIDENFIVGPESITGLKWARADIKHPAYSGSQWRRGKS